MREYLFLFWQTTCLNYNFYFDQRRDRFWFSILTNDVLEFLLHFDKRHAKISFFILTNDVREFHFRRFALIGLSLNYSSWFEIWFLIRLSLIYRSSFDILFPDTYLLNSAAISQFSGRQLWVEHSLNSNSSILLTTTIWTAIRFENLLLMRNSLYK